ncbi:PAS-domain containing protein [Chachezhania sediminis]|uniref:PAS-domain containing protein n=1 Tax=Chachezhania sediminis TaxID=2599291 RepID=UPI001E5DBD1A|nr:PAS-domain containing protein [Chachezhania sediminis]
MHTIAIAELIITTAACTLGAVAAVAWLVPSGRCMIERLRRPGRRVAALPSALAAPDGAQGSVFLFDGSHLIGASGPMREMLSADEGEVIWADLASILTVRFNGVPKSLSMVEKAGRLHSIARVQNDPGEIVYEWLDGAVRVEIRDRRLRTGGPADRRSPGLRSVGAQPGEDATFLARWAHRILIRVVGPKRATGLLEALGGVTAACLAAEKAPYPVWQVDKHGAVVWSNEAYLALCRRVFGDCDDGSRPLFPPKLDRTPDGRPVRHALEAKGTDTKLWFEISRVVAGEGSLFFANDINAVVNAEYAQRNFVQTLAKTFAQLSIGLAIFDRNQRLALFNPALIDLTALPAEFLSARPDLFSFFDRLRDRNVMPEPKDYSTWRQQLSELMAAAANGRYQETWSLPSGSVFSVSGRPHPDGAVAFLFEDITAEVTLTRRFRSDLELGQSVIDSLEDGVAVFTADGMLAFSNPAYCRLWGVDPESSFAQTTIVDAIRVWQDHSKATPAWGDVRDFVTLRENRSEWSATAHLRSGEPLWCGVYPIHGGATLVRFVRTNRSRGDADLTMAPAIHSAMLAAHPGPAAAHPAKSGKVPGSTSPRPRGRERPGGLPETPPDPQP